MNKCIYLQFDRLNESLQSIKARNQKYWWLSKLVCFLLTCFVAVISSDFVPDQRRFEISSSSTFDLMVLTPPGFASKSDQISKCRNPKCQHVLHYFHS